MTNASRIAPLTSITTWLSGGTPDRMNGSYWGGTIPWISAATLKQARIDDSDQYLTEAGVRSGSKMAPVGAILVLVRGMALHRETRIGIVARPVSFNQDIKALIPRPGVLPAFLLYSLQARSKQILDLVSSAGSGTGVLDTQLLRRLEIWVPDEHVQQNVVAAIDAAESYVATLARLIAKKRAIRQGMMQQLLTGKVRLPGYRGIWAETEVEDLLAFKNGLNKGSEYFGAGTPIVNFMDVMNGPIITAEDIDGRVTLTKDEIRRFSARCGDMFFTRTSETVGEVGTAATLVDDIRDSVFSGFILRGRPKTTELDSRFMAHLFQLDVVRQQIMSSATYTTRALTNGRSLSRIMVRLPDVKEQRAIADLVADVEREIAILRRRHKKARALKQGMMQELLTGKTRLPAQGAAA